MIDPAPFLAGSITGFLGLTLLVSAATLPWGVARRLPSLVSEPRTCKVDETGVRLRGSTLLSGEPGGPVLALPRSAFSPQQDAQLLAMLAERSR